jgi:hypothetical protein
VPKGTYVSRVLASKYGEGTAYVSFDGHRGDDYNVYLFATTDYGENWKAIRNGIPETAGTVHVVREHPRNANLLFAGTEFGLWVSWDRGTNWTALKNNLPTVPVDDIEIQAEQNDLVLATHGRSIWIFDDLTPIEKFDSAPRDTLGFAGAQVERGAEDVHGQEPTVWRDLELLPQGSLAARAAEDG